MTFDGVYEFTKRKIDCTALPPSDGARKRYPDPSMMREFVKIDCNTKLLLILLCDLPARLSFSFPLGMELKKETWMDRVAFFLFGRLAVERDYQALVTL